jgi:hypothetical protein
MLDNRKSQAEQPSIENPFLNAWQPGLYGVMGGLVGLVGLLAIEDLGAVSGAACKIPNAKRARFPEPLSNLPLTVWPSQLPHPTKW